MKFIVDMPDELIPQKQEIVSIDLYFMDGKLCGCTYPFEVLETEDDCISRQAAIAVYCDDCILLDICGVEGCFDKSMTYCDYKHRFIDKKEIKNV